MLEKLAEIEKRYEEITAKLYSPEVATDPNQLRKYSKEQKDLKELVETYRTFKAARQELDDAREIIDTSADADMQEMAKEEIAPLENAIEELRAQLKILLLPKDPNDQKNIILEIRAGTGGDESGIFSGDLFRMYERLAERQTRRK